MDSADEFQSSSLDPRTVHKILANRILFLTRECLGQTFLDAFNK